MAEQAQTVQLPKRLPLVIEPSNRGESTAYDAKLINGFTEKKGEEIWIYQRFGTVESSRPPAGNATGRGIFTWRGNVYSVFNNTLYKDGVAVAGTVNNTVRYRFDSCLGSTPKMQLGNGVFGYNYDDSNGLVLISDVDFPSSFVLGWAYLNGTSYVGRATDGGIQGSDINTPTAYDPLNVIIAQIEPDINKALAKQLVYVVDLKQWSGEVFYDAANAAGSPLGRVEGAKFNWGCLSADSVREMDGALIWLGSSKNGSPEIILFNNLKAGVVSSKPVERILQAMDYSLVYSFTLKTSGHRFYVITFPNSNVSLFYDFDENMWGQWADGSGNYLPYVDSCVDASGNIILQHASDGRLYRADAELATDNGTEFTVDIYTPNFDGGVRSRKKVMGMLKLVSDQTAGAFLKVRVNDHDYNPQKWTNFRQMDLSQKDPYLTDCGTFVRRVHNFRYKSAVRMPRIQAMELQLDLGTA